MFKQFLVWVVVLLAVMGAISLAVGGFKLPLSAGPSPTGTHAAPSIKASPSPTATPTPIPTATPAPAPSITPLPSPVQFTISGRGPGNSQQFDLPTLSYVINYSLGGSCQYTGTLDSTDGTYHNTWLANGGADTPPYPITGPTSGSVPLHLQLPGTYVVAMSTGPGCPWTLTFVPQ